MKFILASILVLVFVLLTHPTPVQAVNIWEGLTCHIKGACNVCDALKLARNIVNFLTEVALALAAGFIIFGAVLIMISGGSAERLSSGKKTITSALIGIIIVLSSWVIINTVFQVLTGNLDELLAGKPGYSWATITC